MSSRSHRHRNLCPRALWAQCVILCNSQVAFSDIHSVENNGELFPCLFVSPQSSENTTAQIKRLVLLIPFYDYSQLSKIFELSQAARR